MTEPQKEQIRNLRSEGKSYSEISSALCIPKSTIKSFCSRSLEKEQNSDADIRIQIHSTISTSRPEKSTGKNSPADTDGVCRGCGLPLIQTPGTRKRVFCSKECRVSWWSRHPEASGGNAKYSFICPGCKKPFTAFGNQKRKYCSHQCYINVRFKKGANTDGMPISDDT